MRVLHIVKTAVGAKWAFEQIVALSSLGIDALVALPCDTSGMALRYRAAGIRVIQANLDLPVNFPWRLPAILENCRKVVAEVQPDLIHTHHVGTTFVVRMALGKNSPIPRVFGVTGTLHLESDVSAWLDTHLAGPPDYWIATCRWTECKYKELGIPRDRVFLAYLGTDLRTYSTTRTGILRGQLGLSAKVPLVGMVAMIYSPKRLLGAARGHKGHEDFLVALAHLRERRPDARGVVIGGPWGQAQWYEDSIRYLGEKLCGRGVTFLGTRTDVLEIYPDLDLAVVPSHSDGVAYSVVEALLAGVPVVATNVGGLPDLIRNGETGWLVKPRNPTALSRAILEALENQVEAHRRARVGQGLARTLFDVKRTGKETLEIYEQALGRSVRLPQVITANFKQDQT